jgi:hypothetical protein
VFLTVTLLYCSLLYRYSIYEETEGTPVGNWDTTEGFSTGVGVKATPVSQRTARHRPPLVCRVDGLERDGRLALQRLQREPRRGQPWVVCLRLCAGARVSVWVYNQWKQVCCVWTFQLQTTNVVKGLEQALYST